MNATYPTKQTASRLNLTDNTIRNWSSIYGDFLSEQARPGNGPERRFSDTDITIFEYIKQLKAEGLREVEIKQRLSETSFTENEIISSAPPKVNEATLETHEVTETSLVAQNSPDATAALITTLDAISALRSDVEALKASKINDRRLVRDGVFMFLAGACVSLVLVLIVIVVVDLWVK